jgi:hypothetical protein
MLNEFGVTANRSTATETDARRASVRHTDALFC